MLGVSVTAALGLGGVLARLIVDEEDEDRNAGPAEGDKDDSEDERAQYWVDEPAAYGTLEGEKSDDEGDGEDDGGEYE